MVRFSLAAVLTLAATASAFTSPTTSSRTAFIGTQLSTPAFTTTALQMNLFDRFQRVAKANIDSVLKGMEDPEKIMNQALEDMQTDLVKVRQSYAEVTATQRRLLKQKEQAEALAEDWYKRAQLALQKGAEDLAKEALTRRQAHTDEAAGLQSQVDSQAAAIDKLYEGMQALEKQIMEAKAKKDQFVARARTAQSTQQINDMMSGVTGKTSMDAFKRMEDKVEALEASAEVSAEMGSIGGNMLPGSSGASLESQFKALEASNSVDDELNKLKGLLTDGSSSSSSAESSKAADSKEVDDEFEKLKKEAGL